ncbi:MAG TPA: hypothetical protein VFQ88_06010 [Nevskiaceae bacterium]|nr:hypothetical protein [Nevskiaceae bacterium]
MMATRYLADRDAVPILRVALKDPVDEVRLLAYSLLSSKERVIDQILDALRQAQEQMQAAGNEAELGRIEEQVATLNLEKAELGLVEGSVRQFVLKQALEHITAALRERITGSREFIHGRICLRIALADGERDQIDAAEHAFAAAEQYGMGADKVAPYRAECAFERGAYELVPAQLQRIEPQTRTIPRLAPVVEYWT